MESQSAKQCAQAYVDAKTASAKKKILTQVGAKAKTSKRVRWSRLHADMVAGDETRILARATGDWSKVERKPAKAKPTASAKPKAKAKPSADVSVINALAQELADSGADEQAQLAFLRVATKLLKKS